MSLPKNTVKLSPFLPRPLHRPATKSPSTSGPTSISNVSSSNMLCVSSIMDSSSPGPCTSRSGQCPTKSSETISAAIGLPDQSSRIHLWYKSRGFVMTPGLRGLVQGCDQLAAQPPGLDSPSIGQAPPPD